MCRSHKLNDIFKNVYFSLLKIKMQRAAFGPGITVACDPRTPKPSNEAVAVSSTPLYPSFQLRSLVTPLGSISYQNLIFRDYFPQSFPPCCELKQNIISPKKFYTLSLLIIYFAFKKIFF